MSAHNFGVVGYVPPPSFNKNAGIFYANLQKYPTHYPLVLYSDYDQWGEEVRIIPNPEKVKSPTNTIAVNNFVFLHGLRIAIQQKWTHFIYLEADCRVKGAGWDKVMFDEFLERFPDADMAGTVVLREVKNKTTLYYKPPPGHYMHDKLPYEAKDGTAFKRRKAHPCIYPMGALGIYSVGAMMKIWRRENMEEQARRIDAWDVHHGYSMVDMYGEEEACRHIGQLYSILSWYGPSISEKKLREMLQSGKVVGVHQIKSDWSPS